MNNQKLIITGSNGFIGTSVQQQLSDKYTFVPADNSDPNHPVDITDYSQVITLFQQSSATSVLHLAAFTNVTAAWEQTGDRSGPAYMVNVVGSANIARAAKETNKYLIHVSTSYVFNGEKEEQYLETDEPDPIEWYGKTKFFAELEVNKHISQAVILRIDQPFSFSPFMKKDLVHTIIEQLQKDALSPQFTNHFFGPTIVGDLVKVIDWCVRTQPTGLYHSSSGEMWNNYDYALEIKKALNLPGKVEKGDLDEYLKTLNRPYQRNSAMNCQKLHAAIDFSPMSVMEALKQVEI